MNNQRSIPSLDGLRALAILLVIACHLQVAFQTPIPTVFVAQGGAVGVNIFFVISGFLITHLLLEEVDRNGAIDLKRFFVRRAFRIFPPFYAFLAVAAIVRIFHPDVFRWSSFVSAATYTWNYNLHADGWLLGHTWSLSLEEQFYLFWPFTVTLLPKRSCLNFAVLVVALSPLVRVVTYFLFPALRGHIYLMLPTHLDTIMVGCAMALASNLNAFTRLRAAVARPVWVAVSALMVAIVCPLCEERFRGSFYLPFGITIMSLGSGILVLYAVRYPLSQMGRILNLPFLRHIGVISYSLYLWQQMFTGERTHLFPLNVVFLVVCAELSYWVVERPSFVLRDRLTHWNRKRKPAPDSAPVFASERAG